MEFEKENDIMDQRQEMMDDAIDDVTGVEDEEEGEEVVNQVLDEIGVDLNQSVRMHVPVWLTLSDNFVTTARRDAVRFAEDWCGRRKGRASYRRRGSGRRRPAGAIGQSSALM